MVSPIENRRQVTGLYDWLSRFNLLSNRVMFGSTTADLTMHKTLRIPDECIEKYRGANQRLYIVDLALEAANLPHHPEVLDAGCGFGGTVFRWQERVGGTYDGLPGAVCNGSTLAARLASAGSKIVAVFT